MTAPATSTTTRIEGYGLHTGAPGRIGFVRGVGAVRLRVGEIEAELGELIVEAAGRSTSVRTEDGRLRVRTVEHLFAAMAAASIREGVVVEIEGPEIPLADGGARAFLEALAAAAPGTAVLGAPPPSPPALAILRDGEVRIGESRYAFRPATRSLGSAHVGVEVDFGDVRLDREASWSGDLADFRERVAPARTFAFARELGALLDAGLASHVTPESVVVIADDRILSRGAPFTADEPARHKLLDLIGDLYAHGGPPVGSVRAFRPGHAATHAALREAFAAGIVAQRERVTAV